VKGLKFSLAHLGWPWCDEFIALFGKIQATQHNVLDDQKVRMYIDLTPGVTYISRREVLRKLYLAGYGLEDRVLWGSDNSINNYNTAKVKSYLEFDRAVISDVIVESRENEYFRKIASDAFEKATEKNVNAFYGSE
jgi:predicted TIM-barrel fold metal-dependent hydrolase